MALTDTKVRGLHGRAQKGEKVSKASDGGGLNFQEGKYWRISYRFAGKQKSLAIGVYPDVSLKMARQAGDKARELLAQGLDPGEKRKADKAGAERREQEQARTFQAVAQEYYERKRMDKRDLYRKQTLARFENQIFPCIGHISMTGRRDVAGGQPCGTCGRMRKRACSFPSSARAFRRTTCSAEERRPAALFRAPEKGPTTGGERAKLPENTAPEPCFFRSGHTFFRKTPASE